MGSRMMHFCISKLIGEQLGINSNRFLVGGIAPDIHHIYGEKDKTRSHFMVKGEDGLSRVDYIRFIQKYFDRFDDPFYIGYFTHLISDDIWLKNIYNKRIKMLPREEKIIAQQKNYRDFKRLNYLLLKHYSCHCNLRTINVSNFEEIDISYIDQMIIELKNDFVFDQNYTRESLEFLSLEEVMAFIEESVEKSITELKNIEIVV